MRRKRHIEHRWLRIGSRYGRWPWAQRFSSRVAPAVAGNSAAPTIPNTKFQTYALGRTNRAMRGINERMVPITALNVRFCEYGLDGRLTRVALPPLPCSSEPTRTCSEPG